MPVEALDESAAVDVPQVDLDGSSGLRTIEVQGLEFRV